MSFEKQIISKTSGSGNSTSQVFISNCFADSEDTITQPFYFNVPVYKLNGATFQYYTQNTDGISASLNNVKTFTFLFSANTNSLTGTTKFRHDIYRIDYNTYTAFTSSDLSLTATTADLRVLASGSSPTTTVSTINPNSLTAITDASLKILQSINEPLYTVIEEVSGATFLIASAHTLTLPQKVKPVGRYTEDLFIDKAQYFIDSTFLFEQPVDQTLGDVQMYSGDQRIQLYDMPFSSTSYVQSSNQDHTITGGTFSGTSISGASFTYFIPPKKADIFVVNGRPAVEGPLNTFAPIWSFKNVEDGDFYKVEVNYNTGDTSFTGDSITTFKFKAQPGNAEYVRAVAAAVTPNSEFLYRIGNTKEITNLFSIKQNVTTWSEWTYAKAANDGTYRVSGHTWINAIGSTPMQFAQLSLTVQTTISVVDLGSDATNDPDIESEVTNPLGGGTGSVIVVLSDASGFFDFGKINGGQYTLTAIPSDPNFPTQNISFYVSSDTNLDVVFGLLWGNTVIDFQQLYTYG